MIKVSIIVPVYNVEQYLDRCLKSLVNQTMKDIEILIINDGTLDNSMDVCEKYAKLDNRIKIYNKENEGLGLTRNYGITRAIGEYVCFVDSDDYVDINMCEILYNSAKKYDADAIYGGIFYDDNNNKIVKKPCVNAITVWKGQDEVKELLLDFIATEPNKKRDTIMEVSVWKALFKRSILVEKNILFVSERQFISEDVIFDIDYFLNCNCIVAIPECIYYYCLNQKSLSKTFRGDRFEKVKILYDEIYRKLGNQYPKDVLQLRTDRFLIARARTNAKQIIQHIKIIGEDEATKALKKICEDKKLVDILNRYPIIRLPKKYALVAYLMKYRKYNLIKKILK